MLSAVAAPLQLVANGEPATAALSCHAPKSTPKPNHRAPAAIIGAKLVPA
jgi:hypothetical protein